MRMDESLITLFSSRADGLHQLCRLVKANDCCLEYLSVADSKLKELTALLLNSLISNDSILKLDIRYTSLQHTFDLFFP